jgi:mannose-6-phosphate isomerase-like protein (cupin superfamily)
MSSLILASTDEPSTIYGVHGAAGTSYWKCFARGNVLESALEAWEYAALGPHGLNGEHRHTRTDEVYFFVSGRGSMILDGSPVAIRPHDAVLTPLGACHGLRNETDSLLEWLTIEVTHPQTQRLLAEAARTIPGGKPMPAEVPASWPPARVLNLADGQPLTPTETLSERWRTLEIIKLAPSDERPFEAGQVEHAAYVLYGDGSARSADEEIALQPGTALTLPRGSSATLVAGAVGLEVFHVALETAF